MTDWTRENKEDDKFIEWMNNDKKLHEDKAPENLKKKKNIKKIFVLGILISLITITLTVIFSSNSEFSSEDYFYIPDYRLNKSPVFCAKEFSDPVFISANNIVIQKTENAVKEWQNRIEKYTNTDGDWKFEFKKIAENSQFSEFGCDTTITFEQTPPPIRKFTRGETALSQYGFSDVVIFYLDPVTRDKIDPKIDMIIKHEIGHVLGLGHPVFNEMYDGRPFYIENEQMISRSIMITPEVYPFLPKNLIYTITDYDVRSVVNLYGGGISNSPIFFGYLNYVIIAIILFIIALVVSKKIKQY